MRRTVLCLLSSLLALAAAAAAAPPAARPNIILIVADDLGYGELGSYGQTIIQTPHLDRLAAEGIRFTQFYAGSTVCAPSRSVLMTGQHTGHTRVRGNAGAENYAPQTLGAGDVTVARVLQQAGYATALVGKWGLGETGSEGEPNRHGFDYFFGFVNQTHAHNHYPDFLWRNTEKVALAERRDAGRRRRPAPVTRRGASSTPPICSSTKPARSSSAARPARSSSSWR